MKPPEQRSGRAPLFRRSVPSKAHRTRLRQPMFNDSVIISELHLKMVFPKMDMPEPPHSRNDPCTLAVLNFLKLRFERLYGNSQLMSRGEPCMGLPLPVRFPPGN